MKRAGNIARSNLISLGTCFGKFTKTGKFRLQITALDYLAPYAKVFITLITALYMYLAILLIRCHLFKTMLTKGSFWTPRNSCDQQDFYNCACCWCVIF